MKNKYSKAVLKKIVELKRQSTDELQYPGFTVKGLSEDDTAKTLIHLLETGLIAVKRYHPADKYDKNPFLLDIRITPEGYQFLGAFSNISLRLNILSVISLIFSLIAILLSVYTLVFHK